VAARTVQRAAVVRIRLILFEFWGDYAIILPLMPAIVLAAGISDLASHDTVFARKRLRCGTDVSEVMTTPPTPVDAGASLRRSRPASRTPVAARCRSPTSELVTSAPSPRTT
jgi:hypothetical protein